MKAITGGLISQRLCLSFEADEKLRILMEDKKKGVDYLFIDSFVQILVNNSPKAGLAETRTFRLFFLISFSFWPFFSSF